MKIQLEIGMSKKTMDYLVQAWIREAEKVNKKRELAAKKGWETRRKNAK